MSQTNVKKLRGQIEKLKEMIREVHYKDYVVKINEINTFKQSFRERHYGMTQEEKKMHANSIINMQNEIKTIEQILFKQDSTARNYDQRLTPRMSGTTPGLDELEVTN